MSYSLADIRQFVNNELENHPLPGKSVVDVDGTATEFYMGPPGFFPIDDGTATFSVDGVAVAITVDDTSALATTATAPSAGTGTFTFNYVSWRDEVVDRAINATINSLFPAFYVAGTDTTQDTDGSTYEFDMPDAVEFVTAVELRSDSTSGWVKQAKAKYEVFRDGLHKVLRFYSAPSAGEMRVRTISRPEPLVADADELSDIGLPERALDCIISGSVYYLLNQKSAPRIRSDVAVATMGTGTIFPTMMNQVAQGWLMRYQFQLASDRMTPWMSR